MCDEKLALEHTKLLAEIKSRSESNTHRLNTMENLVDAVHSMGVSMAKQTGFMEQMGKDLTSMVKTLEKHENAIEDIKEKMETKESVARLHGKVEEIKGMVTKRDENEEAKKLKEFEDMKKFITKVLVGVGVTVVGALVVFAIVVLTGLANAGQLGG